MIVRCNNCKTDFFISGINVFFALTGGINCTECGGNIDIIVRW